MNVEDPLDRLCEESDVSRTEVLTLSRDEFRQISRGILRYDAVRHAAAFRAWEEAKRAVIELSDDDQEDGDKRGGAAGLVETPRKKQERPIVFPVKKVENGEGGDKKRRAEKPGDLGTKRSKSHLVSVRSGNDDSLKRPSTVKVKEEEEGEDKGAAMKQMPKKIWTETVRRASNIFRMREFVTRAVDRWGRNPALYCIANGVIMNSIHSSVVNALLPSTDVNVETATQAIDSLPRPTTEGMKTAQWNLDCLFCAMRRGDIVCLMVPNESARHEVYCGIVSSDKVLVKKTDDLVAHNCGLRDFKDLPHLVLREVQWIRKARVRYLPGQCTNRRGAQYVKWLLETSPKFLGNVTEGARAYLACEGFWACSTSVNALDNNAANE